MRVPAFISTQIRQADPVPWPWQQGLFGRLIEAVRREVAAQQSARQLAALDDRMLKDIGITRSDIPAIAASLKGGDH